MTEERAKVGIWGRWGPAIVIVSAVAVFDIVAAGWVVARLSPERETRAIGSASPALAPTGPIPVPGGVRAPVVDAAAFTPELEAWLAEAASARGIDPGALPKASEMYAQMVERGVLLPPEFARATLEAQAPDLAAKVGDDYLKLTLTLDVVARSMMSQDSQPGTGPQPGTGQNRPAGPYPSSNSIEELDRLLAVRSSRQASELGIDPSEALPAESMRKAAVATGMVDSPESQALLQAYSDIFSRLEAQARENP